MYSMLLHDILLRSFKGPALEDLEIFPEDLVRHFIGPVKEVQPRDF